MLDAAEGAPSPCADEHQATELVPSSSCFKLGCKPSKGDKMTRESSATGAAPFVVLLVAFAALGVWASDALAGNDKGQVTVNVENYNDDCGESQGKKVIGTDTFKRSGDTLSVTHRVHGADPGTYDLYLYDAADCGSSTTSASTRSTVPATGASRTRPTSAAPAANLHLRLEPGHGHLRLLADGQARQEPAQRDNHLHRLEERRARRSAARRAPSAPSSASLTRRSASSLCSRRTAV